MVNCKSCGTHNPAGSKFCGHCGLKLAEVPPAAPAPQTPPPPGAGMPPAAPAPQAPPPPPPGGMLPGGGGYGQPPVPGYPTVEKLPGDAGERTAQLGLKRSTAGVLCYAFGWLSGIVLFLLERDAYVRFHAAQSVAVFGGLSLLSMVLPTVLPRGLWNMISSLMSLLSTLSMGLWVFLMYKAHKGEYYKLPVVGDVVERFVRKNTA